ncbi:hypothetical protein LguiA_007555 [Lonicera macranthoides]
MVRSVSVKAQTSREFSGGLTAARSFYLIERRREKKRGLPHSFSTRAEKTMGSPIGCTICHVGEKIYVLSLRLQTPSTTAPLVPLMAYVDISKKTTGSPIGCIVCYMGEKIYVLFSRLQTPSTTAALVSLMT